MNKKTAKALEGSITHWKENLEKAENNYTKNLGWKDIYFGQEECPLCDLFNKDPDIYSCDETSCRKCPIKKATNRLYCHGTPFKKIGELYKKYKRIPLLKKSKLFSKNYGIMNREIMVAIHQEVKFLEAMREKKRKK